jgi:hypothetical protein
MKKRSDILLVALSVTLLATSLINTFQGRVIAQQRRLIQQMMAENPACAVRVR